MSKYILLGAIVLLAGMASIIWYQANKIDGLTAAVATEKANVARLAGEIEEQNESIRRLELQRAKDQLAMDALGQQISAAQLEKEKTVAKFNQYRTRLEGAALAKPGLVGRAATRATRRVQLDFLRASGGGEADQGNPAVSPRPAKSNRAATGQDQSPDAKNHPPVE